MIVLTYILTFITGCMSGVVLMALCAANKR